MRKGILLACACVLCLSACGTGTKEQSKNPQKALEVGVETTPKSVEATSSPMVQKIMQIYRPIMLQFVNYFKLDNAVIRICICLYYTICKTIIRISIYRNIVLYW